MKHTVRADFEFHHAFFDDAQTRFGVNLELRSGQPFSAVMNDNTFAGTGCNPGGRACVFGTTNTSAHLLYVPDFSLAPTNGGLTYGNVTFANAASRDALMAQVLGSNLKNYQGSIAPKNSLFGPWYYKMDLNFAQQIPFFLHGKVTALLSVENFLNLLNHNWGTYQDYGNSQTLVFVSCTGATTNGQTCPQYQYSTAAAKISTTSIPKYSLYAIRVGVRMDF